MNKTRMIAIYLCLFALFTASSFLAGCSGGSTGMGAPPEVPSNPPPTAPNYPGTPTPTGTITGSGTIEGNVSVVIDETATKPAENAFVALMDQPLSTFTDKDGNFLLQNVEAGERLMLVSFMGSKSAGTVNVEEGKTTVLTIVMPSPQPPDPTGGTDTGKLTIRTYSFYQGDQWVGVNYIRVWEKGNYSKRWFQSWNDFGNEGQSNYELSCYGAEKNKYYVAEIQWYNGDNQQKDTIYLYQDDQVEFIEHK